MSTQNTVVHCTLFRDFEASRIFTPETTYEAYTDKLAAMYGVQDRTVDHVLRCVLCGNGSVLPKHERFAAIARALDLHDPESTLLLRKQLLSLRLLLQ